MQTPQGPKHPWFKRWQVWLGVGATIFVFGSMIHSYDQKQKIMALQQMIQTGNTTGTAKPQKDATSELSASDTNNHDESSSDSQSNDLEVHSESPVKITDKKSYPLSFSDDNYMGSKLKITNIDVMKTNPFKSDEADTKQELNGILTIDMEYTAGKSDMELFDSSATINTSDGQQVKVDFMDSESIDELNAGGTKKGKYVFLLPKLDKTTQFTSIRFKMSAEPKDVNNTDMHDYDMTINLNDKKSSQK
ncbi:hypothetical protein [Levilactobacillus spicheri]|uniref:DUF4352 domain-containing protein n=1 Tax=Levilactobacillus spicheri TaxID=216463 RepID=A0A0F3RR97_9LACO|nr:hypothetical protein [Levilactobacillus spicheri]KJW12558.1 hypothetical protein VC81_08750 [Levilactobacillus spicheri]